MEGVEVICLQIEKSGGFFESGNETSSSIKCGRIFWLPDEILSSKDRLLCAAN
jgi:hypothetical protein